MPAYNTADTIEASIRSVLAQTRADFELVVVDDGSTDGTAAVVEALAADMRVRLLRQENRGAAAARNAALAAGRGHYFSFVDSDDLWLPNYLEAMAAVLEPAPARVGFAYTDAWMLHDVTGQIGKNTAMTAMRPPREPPASAGELLLELIDRNFVYNSVTARRDVFDQVGNFEETLRAAIDYEMWLRIAAKGYVAVSPPGPLAVFRCYRSGSIMSDRARMCTNLSLVFERIAAEWPISDQARRAALRRKAAVEAELTTLERAADGPGNRRIRPLLARIKHTLFPAPDEWLDSPPDELVAIFPELFGRPAGGSLAVVAAEEQL
jgi:glycosyltransferase involved in cell wall biosynthesis